MADAGRKPRVTPADALDLFADREDRAEPLTSNEVADALNCSRKTAYNKLVELEDAGEVTSKKVGGRSRVWWVPITEDPTQGGESGPERAETSRTVDTGGSPAPSADRDERADTADLDAALDDVDLPAGQDRAECMAAIAATRDYLRDEGQASMREIVAAVMLDHPLGYEVPDLEPGDRYRGAWWRRIVKPGLEALDDVEPPSTGRSKWRYTGGE